MEIFGKNYPIDLADMDEPDVREWIIPWLSQYFEIEEEQKGRFLVDGTEVIIDYLIKAKPELIEKGFIAEKIGFEVKRPSDLKNLSAWASWQAITYSMSQFQGERPPFVILFPRIRYFYKNKEECSHAYALENLLFRANVGFLDFTERGSWRFDFNGKYYWDSVKGLGDEHHRALKRYVGTKK